MPDVPFSRPAYSALETLAEAMDVPVTEAVRRALILLDTYNTLAGDECLAIVNDTTKTTERLHFRWEQPEHSDGQEEDDQGALIDGRDDDA